MHPSQIGGEFLGGDPANHVAGKPEEKPARRHGRQKPKPKVKPLPYEERLHRDVVLFEQRQLDDIRRRMKTIAPQIKEIPKLEEAEKALKEIKKNGKKHA